MGKPHTFVWFFAAGLALGMAAQARADTVITFDDLGDSGPNGILLTNQYDSIGADFGGTATVYSEQYYNYKEYPPYSGANVAFDSSEPIKVSAVGGTWSNAGGYVTTGISGYETLSAYDSSGKLLTQDEFEGPNTAPSGTPNTYLSVSAPDIAYVTFSDSGNYVYYTSLDNFTFDLNPSIASAPLPTALGAGLGLLAGLGCCTLTRRLKMTTWGFGVWIQGKLPSKPYLSSRAKHSFRLARPARGARLVAPREQGG